MLQMQKRLKVESQLSDIISKVKDIVTAMETTLHALVNGTIHTNKLLQQLLDTPLANIQTLADNKKGEKEVGGVEHHPSQSSQIDVALNPQVPATTTSYESATRKRRIKTLAQRD